MEALSRGAAYCLFVEQEVEARALIRRNVEALGLTGVTKIFRRDATELGPAGRNGGFTLAFLDPPYGQDLAQRALVAAAQGDWLAPRAIAVIEERKDASKPLFTSSCRLCPSRRLMKNGALALEANSTFQTSLPELSVMR